MVDFSEIDFPKFQQKITPLNDENLSILELGSSLQKYDCSNLTETEKAVINIFIKISAITLTSNVETSAVIFPSGMENITNDEMGFLAKILENIINKMLKARVTDILWFRYYAAIVIKSYFSIDFNTPKFLEKFRYWRRGLSIAKETGQNDLLNAFEQNALNYLYKTEFEGDYCVLDLIKLLRTFGLCTEQKDEIIKKAVEWGDRLKNVDCCSADLYYDEASLWADPQKQSDEYVKLQTKRVETNIDEAKKSESMALTHNGNALKIVQTLPKKHRKYFSGKQKKALIRNRKLSGKDALSEMEEIYLPFNPGKMTESLNDIKGKDKQTALRNFAFLEDYVREEELEKNAFRCLQENPTSFFFNTTILSDDGRIVANVPGIDFDILTVNSKTPAIVNNMIQQYMVYIAQVANDEICHALEIIRCEHDIQLSDIVEIVEKSDLIPADRVEVFARGLYAGFSYDFMVALHLLIPQIENMVRLQFQKKDIQTSQIKEDVELEKSLSGLVKHEKFADIFGKDCEFEFRALFCEDTGLNLRNNVAHGLLSSEAMKSVYIIYFWWFCFKLVYSGFYNTERNEDKK